MEVGVRVGRLQGEGEGSKTLTRDRERRVQHQRRRRVHLAAVVPNVLSLHVPDHQLPLLPAVPRLVHQPIPGDEGAPVYKEEGRVSDAGKNTNALSRALNK